MLIPKLIAVALLAALLVVNPGGHLTLEIRFLLLGVLLIGSVIWLMPKDEQEAEEQEREANEERWRQEQQRNEEDQTGR
jgi:flagellar biosynthesis component FlhA